MKERPVIFSGAMVRAILEGRKTQTRRICKQLLHSSVQGVYHRPDGLFMGTHLPVGAGVGVTFPFSCPYGFPGDRLWVRESFAAVRVSESYESSDCCYFDWEGPLGNEPRRDMNIYFRADSTEETLPAEFSMPHGSEIRWRPSIHMPRWASRITLEVTGVRVERLQDISEEDAKAEGIVLLGYSFAHQDGTSTPYTHKDHFEALWDDIHGQGAWEINPWVWVIEFKRLEDSQPRRDRA